LTSPRGDRGAGIVVRRVRHSSKNFLTPGIPRIMIHSYFQTLLRGLVSHITVITDVEMYPADRREGHARAEGVFVGQSIHLVERAHV